MIFFFVAGKGLANDKQQMVDKHEGSVASTEAKVKVMIKPYNTGRLNREPNIGLFLKSILSKNFQNYTNNILINIIYF